MNNILVLGAGILQVPLINAVIHRGYNPVVVSLVSTEPGMKMVKDSVIADFCDEQAILKIAKEFNVCGIATDQTDLPVRTIAYVADKLGLPSIGYDTACLFTDKYLMRERCRALGLSTINYSLCYSIEDLKAFIDAYGFPVILKPRNNQGSKGVVKLDNYDDMYLKYPQSLNYSRNCPLIVEEFVKGDEIVIESVVVDDAVHLLICGDTYYFDIPDAFAAKQRIFPSQKDITIIKAASELNEKIIKGFGLKTGLTHGEYIIKDGKVYLLEIAARGGGVFISSDIIPLMTGFDTTSFIIDTAAGIRPDFKLSKPVYACACYLAFFLPEGEILSIDGVDKVKSMPNVYHHNLDSFYTKCSIPKDSVNLHF